MTRDDWIVAGSATVVAVSVFVAICATAFRNAHVVYDGRSPEENYAFFLSECAKARFDGQQCEFLGRIGRITGRPALEEKGDYL
jgi:hypothetical protein